MKFDWHEIEENYEDFLSGKACCHARMGNLVLEAVYMDEPVCDGRIRFDSPAVPFPMQGNPKDYPFIHDEHNPETGLVELNGGDASIYVENFAKDASHPTFEEFRRAAERELIAVYTQQYHVPECLEVF